MADGSGRRIVVVGLGVVMLAALAGVVWRLAGRETGFAVTATAAPPLATDPPAAEADAVAAELVLRGDGVGEYRFGDAVDAVVPSLTAFLGDPNVHQDEACRSGITQFVRYADLGLFFAEDVFVGWIIGVHYPQERPPLGLETSWGLQLNDPVTEIEAPPGGRIAVEPIDEIVELRISIPNEGEILGILEGDAPPTLIAMNAGTQCDEPPPVRD